MHQGVGDSFLYLLDAGRDPSKREDNSLDIFFGSYDSLGSCTQLPDGTTLSGKIESVAFIPASIPANAPGAVRITVTARLGKAAIPDKILSICGQSNFKRRPTIATVLLRYQFLFDGQKVVSAEGNPPTENGWAVAPMTSYSAAK